MNWEKTIIDSLEWGKEISNREEKQKVADKIASMVKDGDIIGVGSGSTAYLALLKIADPYPDRTVTYPRHSYFPGDKNGLCQTRYPPDKPA